MSGMSKPEMLSGKLMERTVQDFLDELASGSPAPGGGSVSALAGSLAASLVAMVARLSGGELENDDMAQVLREASALKESLGRHVDEDTNAFNRVMQAYRLPKVTGDEKEKRSEVIQRALKGAADHPMLVAQECLRVLQLCREVAASGNPNALSDAGVAAMMAYSGITGAMFNVAINLDGIKDAEYTARAGDERDRVMSEAAALYEEFRWQMLERMPHMVEW